MCPTTTTTIDFPKGAQTKQSTFVVTPKQFELKKETTPPLHFFSTQMTTSKRLAERKVAKFEKNITRRGSVSETSSKKGHDYPVGPLVLGFFVFVVIGSSLFQIISTALGGGMAWVD